MNLARHYRMNHHQNVVVVVSASERLDGNHWIIALPQQRYYSESLKLADTNKQ